MILSKSPNRFSFQKENYMKRKAEEGRTPDNDEDVKAMNEYYDNWAIETAKKEQEESWKENNMEYDLRSTDWILEKVRKSNAYAQNLYAAMCNNEFQKNEFMPRLAGQTWSCSWRYAGGIIADMKQEGDYIDWYCSGIKNDSPVLLDEQFYELTKEQQEYYIESKSHVGESYVTDEIRADLKKLGWDVIEDNPDKY
jgi:hypothetical protein